MVLEYLLPPGGNNLSPYVSAAALESILARVSARTEKGKQLLEKSLKILGRKEAGDLTLAEEITNCIPEPDFVLGPEEAERQRAARKPPPPPLLKVEAQPADLNSTDDQDLYAMSVIDGEGNFVAYKIGRSVRPETRSIELDGDARRKDNPERLLLQPPVHARLRVSLGVP